MVIAAAVNAAGVACALIRRDAIDEVDRAVDPSLIAVECKHDRQLFAGKRVVLANPVLLNDEEGAVRSKLDPGELSDPGSRFCDNLNRWNMLTFGPHHSLEAGFFGERADMAALGKELLL